MNGRRIENDEQLQRSLDWLVEKAKQLDHPLMDEETKARMMPTYDFVSQRVMEYRREQTARKFHYLQRIDEELGLSAVQEGPQAAQGQPEPITEAKRVNLSDWLDD
jgi:hypothetical protein